MNKYEALDPGNAKMRGLADDVLDAGAWQLAWIPPSLPYYELVRALRRERAGLHQAAGLLGVERRAQGDLDAC